MNKKEIKRKFIYLIIAILTLGVVVDSQEEEFHYFQDKIDYWPEDKSKMNAPIIKPILIPEKNEVIKNQEKFSWDKFNNPQNKEFFKEGDYTPPEPFMEVVKDPSNYNLKMWFNYIEKKNLLATRLEQRMQEYLNANQKKFNGQTKEVVAEKMSKIEKADQDAGRYMLRLYFSSTCPHCQKMFQTVRELQTKGYFFQLKQIDEGKENLRGIPFPVESAKKEEIKRDGVQGVPLLIIADLKRKILLNPMQGYQSTEDVIQYLKQSELSKIK